MGYISEIRKKVGHDTVIMVGAAVIPVKNGQMLLQKRRDNGAWAVHGGCVEIGEDVETAARREFTEETGLVAGKLEMLGVYSGEDMLFTYPNGDRVSIVSVVYLAEDCTGQETPQPEEVECLRWFPADALPEPISSPDVRPIRDAAERILRKAQQA